MFKISKRYNWGFIIYKINLIINEHFPEIFDLTRLNIHSYAVENYKAPHTIPFEILVKNYIHNEFCNLSINFIEFVSNENYKSMYKTNPQQLKIFLRTMQQINVTPYISLRNEHITGVFFSLSFSTPSNPKFFLENLLKLGIDADYIDYLLVKGIFTDNNFFFDDEIKNLLSCWLLDNMQLDAKKIRERVESLTPIIVDELKNSPRLYDS